jgi:hypothetical protein
VQTKLFLSFIACAAAFTAPVSLAQQSTPAAAPFEIRGHYIGEPVKRFFRLDFEARGEMEVCHQNPNRPACGRLLDAIEYGKRADISTTVPADLDHPEGDRETTNFVLDGGKLVKISMLANAAPEDLKSLGRPTSEKSIPAHDTSGAKWENHLTIWDTPTLYVSLYLDNNPTIQDHRLTLTIEAPTEHTRENPEAAESPKQSSAVATPPAAAGAPVSTAAAPATH